MTMIWRFGLMGGTRPPDAFSGFAPRATRPEPGFHLVQSRSSLLLQPPHELVHEPDAAVDAICDLALFIDQDGRERVLDRVALEFPDDPELREQLPHRRVGSGQEREVGGVD